MLWALFISPLLALASDQTRKLRNVTTTHSDYVSLHLDDTELSSIQELANNLSTMNDSQTSQCQRHSDYEYPFGYKQLSSQHDSNGRSLYCISVW